MRRWWVPLGLLLAGSLAGAARWPVLARPKPLELARKFAVVRDQIQPRPEEELWKTIPWKTSLLEARDEAAREGKPIFLWSMDGHPLCHG